MGDSGELVAAVHSLGIPHPSGYPLYVLLGKLWTLAVPVGSIAFRMSLFSAACAGLACGLLHLVARRAGASLVPAATGALLLGFAPSFWGEANIQRVYALNAVFVAAGLGAALEWHRSRQPRALVAAFAICGIGAANHTFMAVFAIAVGLFALITVPRLALRPAPLLQGAAAFACGLLPYLFLLWRSGHDPRLDWGNPETLSSLWAVMSRRDFWERRYIESAADLVPITWDWLRSFGPELQWLGAVLAGVGLFAGYRRGFPVLLPLLVLAGNLGSMALHGSRSDIFIWHRYYIPSYVMACLLAALGAEALLQRLPRRAQVLLLLLPVAGFLSGRAEFDRSRYQIAEDFSRTLLQSVPPGAHLAASDDNVLFVLIYLELVEHLRPDVDLILQGVGDAALPPLRFDPDRDPLFLTHHPNWSVPGLDVVPVGLVFRTVRAGQPLPPAVIPKTTLAGEDDPRVPRDYLTQNLLGHFHYMLGLTWEFRDWARASAEMQRAQAAAPDNDVLFYNLGLIYRRNGLLPEALRAFERAHQINPRAIPGRTAARASDKLAEMRRDLAQLEAAEAALRPTLRAAPGTSEWEMEMAAALEARGLMLPARGHALRAALLRAQTVR